LFLEIQLYYVGAKCETSYNMTPLMGNMIHGLKQDGQRHAGALPAVSSTISASMCLLAGATILHVCSWGFTSTWPSVMKSMGWGKAFNKLRANARILTWLGQAEGRNHLESVSTVLHYHAAGS
jgi:hypothetical protein